MTARRTVTYRLRYYGALNDPIYSGTIYSIYIMSGKLSVPRWRYFWVCLLVPLHGVIGKARDWFLSTCERGSRNNSKEDDEAILGECGKLLE